MQFRPFVYDAMNRQVPVAIEPMTPQDAALTDREPLWQTSWASEYLANEGYEKYAARVGDELIALAAYEVLPTALVVHIVYMEAQPESNPTLDGGIPKYRGIGRLLIAYGIKRRRRAWRSIMRKTLGPFYFQPFNLPRQGI